MVNKEKIQEAVRYMVKKTERELQCEARLDELQSLRKEVGGIKMMYHTTGSFRRKVISLLDERIKKLS